jgi:hypothetical protein
MSNRTRDEQPQRVGAQPRRLALALRQRTFGPSLALLLIVTGILGMAAGILAFV